MVFDAVTTGHGLGGGTGRRLGKNRKKNVGTIHLESYVTGIMTLRTLRICPRACITHLRLHTHTFILSLSHLNSYSRSHTHTLSATDQPEEQTSLVQQPVHSSPYGSTGSVAADGRKLLLLCAFITPSPPPQ